jgi:uncharacterized membrane protein
MKIHRLDGLSDAIFAIVMTLLIIEIRVPEFHTDITETELWHALRELAPLCLGYVLSFALLFTYWRAHYFVLAAAKQADIRFTNYNALFLFSVGLIPFATHLLGRYSYTHLAIILYGINILFVGISLFAMRRYITKCTSAEEKIANAKSTRHANIRILTPVVLSFIAMCLCFANTTLSLLFFTLTILFNLTPKGADTVDALISPKIK